MRAGRVIFDKLTKPQTVLFVAIVAVMALGASVIPRIIRPEATAVAPVIQQPEEGKVESAAVQEAVDCARVACLALTFDDGPHSEVTPRVLDALERYGAKATFFIIGSRAASHSDLVRLIHSKGHEIGNHTWSHRNLSKLSPQEVQDEVFLAQNAIASTGVPAPTLLRPPYGAVNSVALSHIPMSVIKWSVDPKDWLSRDAEQIAAHVLAHARPGAIVDLHDIYSATADAVEPILATLSQTYQLVTVSELLNLMPGQPGVFSNR